MPYFIVIFDVAVSALLRSKGHDVIGVRQLNVSKGGDGWTDDDVLYEAIRLRRIILTDNVTDFRSWTKVITWHEGIVLCSVENDAANRAEGLIPSCGAGCGNEAAYASPAR